MSRLEFQVEAKAAGSRARAGRLTTLHDRDILTPIFMPVGTQATVKAQYTPHLHDAGSRILLANTYHLLLRPGPETFRKMGGIQKFMGWNHSVLTDSGGFQIFSLAKARKVTEEGAAFRSYIDRRTIQLSPEISIEMQKAIGSDIMMALDVCEPSVCDHRTAREAMERSHRWAIRSLAARGDSPQAMFGIVQGACFEDLRRESVARMTESRLAGDSGFQGYAIGGLAVGETSREREDFTELTAALLPENMPRYLMGVGTPLDILEAVHRGVDMFDCILPGALAQQGVAFTGQGRVYLRRSVYAHSEEPLEAGCDCPTCQVHTRAYLRHLYKSQEVLGWQLVGLHNIHFYHRLMRNIRAAIVAGTFSEFLVRTRSELKQTEEENPGTPPKARKRKPKGRTGLGDYEVHASPQGHFSIRQRSSGEVMHSVSEPLAEATRLYVEQGMLRERLTNGDPRPLVIWDVGLGAATNAMAAVRAIEESFAATASSGAPREVRLVSFERDLDPLRLALANHHQFKYLRHSGPSGVLERGEWTSKEGPLHWRLVQGDFFEWLAGEGARETPELIFFDPFSPKVDAQLWTEECFRRLRLACGDEASWIFTYSNSTAVRQAMLAAGFYVAAGAGTPPKSETTVALTPAAAAREGARWNLLDSAWLDRWSRSSARDPSREGVVRSHPQFNTAE